MTANISRLTITYADHRQPRVSNVPPAQNKEVLLHVQAIKKDLLLNKPDLAKAIERIDILYDQAPATAGTVIEELTTALRSWQKKAELSDQAKKNARTFQEFLTLYNALLALQQLPQGFVFAKLAKVNIKADLTALKNMQKIKDRFSFKFRFSVEGNLELRIDQKNAIGFLNSKIGTDIKKILIKWRTEPESLIVNFLDENSVQVYQMSLPVSQESR